ncbi:MAG: Transcriptional regulatory protein [Candidatus Saccharibacteria bacterium]|nr:Transcriptional regulatory protein [Candidatus Saccharibacteria bacterium]
MQTLSEFLKQFRVRTFQKGEIILVEGEVPPSAYVVKKGVVKTYNLTAEGQEKPISFDVEYEVFPIGWVFSKIPATQYFYEAFTDCEIFLVPREAYVDYISGNPKATTHLLDDMIDRHLQFQMRVNALEQSKAAHKVINTLHYLCLGFGTEIKPDTVRVDLPLTQQDLANYMGLTRETTGIELKKLEKQGIISYKRQNYIIRTNRLNEVLDDEYDPGLSFN